MDTTNTGLKNLNSWYSPYQSANPTAAAIGNVTGQVASTAPLALAAPEMGAASFLGRAGTGAALGMGSAAFSPVDPLQPGQNFTDQKLGQIGTGAAIGGIAAPLAGMLGDVIQGAGGPAQRALAQAGVPLTPGQILGGRLATMESKATSLPLIGDMIKGAQNRSVQGFNRATYDQVLAPLGRTYSGPVGQDGVNAVRQTIGDAYNSALSNMTFRANDPQFKTDILQLGQMAEGLGAPQKQTFLNTVKTQIFGKLSPQDTMDGPQLQGVQSELGRLARGYQGDPSFDNRQLGAAIGEVKNAIDQSLPRYNPPEAVENLSNANAAWSNFTRLRTAAGSQGAMNNGGVFTPAQLQNAVRAGDRSVGKGATAAGTAPMQNWSQTGMEVLGRGYPDSGTAGRLGTAGVIGAIAGHPEMLLNPATYLAAAPAMAYTPYGQKLAQALLMNRPASAQALGAAVNRFAPAVSALGLPAFAGLPQQ
ncbi:hypothetical protein [Candidimonas nitroreducens]|nr:hypothetical protein [Candidimonas nitroreducens]